MPANAKSTLIVWRDPKVVQDLFACGTTPSWYPLNQEAITAFDEQEHPQTITGMFPFPAATQMVHSTCTRSDVLSSGAYPAITVTVNVSANATSPLVNQVSVSGGGLGSANASDSTALQGALSVNRTTLNYGPNGLVITSPQTVLVTITAGSTWR